MFRPGNLENSMERKYTYFQDYTEARFSPTKPTKIHLVMGINSLTLKCNQIIYLADIFQHFRI